MSSISTQPTTHRPKHCFPLADLLRFARAQLRQRILPALAVMGAVLCLAQPVRAELRVTVSRTLTGRFESVGITVVDPLHGLDLKPGPLVVTMADGNDHRQDLAVQPGDRAGEWHGRFTPLAPGRYTGTVVLHRQERTEIGLVPVIRVRPSSRPGFIRQSPRRGRTLTFTRGGSLFPVGFRLDAQDLRSAVDWKQEFRRLRASGVNYLELAVPPAESLPSPDRARLYGAVDNLLLLAERAAHFGIQLRVDPGTDASGDEIANYEEHIRFCVRRWSFSPAVSVWYLSGITEATPAEVVTRLVRAARGVDSYNHLVAVPDAGSERRGGADLTVAPFNWQRPVNRYALFEAQDVRDGPAPLPGENSWQMLVMGGLGLPLWPYHPGADGNRAVLARVAQMARSARSIPFQVAGTQVVGTVAADTPGSFCRYGRVLNAWTAPEPGTTLKLHSLPRGKYVVHLWDPANDSHLADPLVWSDGHGSELTLPPGLKAVYLQAEPAGKFAAAPRPGKALARPAHTAPPVRRTPQRHVATLRERRQLAWEAHLARLRARQAKQHRAAPPRRPVRPRVETAKHARPLTQHAKHGKPAPNPAKRKPAAHKQPAKKAAPKKHPVKKPAPHAKKPAPHAKKTAKPTKKKRR